MCGHRANIRRKKQLIGEYCRSSGHTVKDFSVQIIEKLHEKQGETNIDFTQRMLDREKFWILELGTLFPFGLNDNLKGVGNITKLNINVAS